MPRLEQSLVSPVDEPARDRSPRPRGHRARRGGIVGAALALATVAAWPEPAQARTREGHDDRPWGRGVLTPTIGLGAGGFFSDIANLSFGLGFGYYIVNGLSVGLSVSDTILIYRSPIKAQFPGIEDALPTNIFEVTPSLQYVFFRSRRFSPYVFAGVGPVVFNHGAGTFGQWVAGPGAYFNVAGPLFINFGVSFSGLFPTDQCRDALTYQPAPVDGMVSDGVFLDLCSFRWGPQLGVVLAFGGGKKARRERRERERPDPSYPPASNPMDEAVEPEPAPTPTEPAPLPTEEATPPAGAEPTVGPEPPPAGTEPTPGDAPPADAPVTGEAPPPAGPDAPPAGPDTPPAGPDAPPAGPDATPPGADAPPPEVAAPAETPPG